MADRCKWAHPMCGGASGGLPGPPNLGHAEPEDAAMVLQESPEQGALSRPPRSTQDNRPVLRNVFRDECYNLTRECDKAENL